MQPHVDHLHAATRPLTSLVNKTGYLMHNRNWRGLVLDANVLHIETIRNDEIFWKRHLDAKSAFITRENVNDTIGQSGYAGEIGLLSIDIDGNDYWVFDALTVVQPDIVLCEYNAILGDVHALTIPYDPAFQRTIAHFSWLYFGASIRAPELAAARKGYSLIGSNAAGHNAFFVRADLASRLSVEDRQARPSLFRETRSEDGSLSYFGGLDRLALIAEMPVVDLETGRTVPLGSFGDLYSPAWRARMAP